MTRSTAVPNAPILWPSVAVVRARTELICARDEGAHRANGFRYRQRLWKKPREN
jgi:hypothetical protein